MTGHKPNWCLETVIKLENGVAVCLLVQASFATLCPWLLILQLGVAAADSAPFACREDFELPGVLCEISLWLKALRKFHAPFKFFMH